MNIKIAHHRDYLPGPDAEDILNTLCVIESNTRHWNQSVYSCRTAMCLAGWCAYLHGLRPCHRWFRKTTETFIYPDGRRISPYTFAKQTWRLTEEQADTLFYKTCQLTDISDLRWVVQKVIDGCVFTYCVCENGEVWIDGTDPVTCDHCDGLGLVSTLP